VELVRKLRGCRLAEEAAALAGHVEAHVDRLLDVPARLDEHLAHLAAHQLRELLFPLDQQPAEAVQELAAPRRGNEAPALVGGLRGLDGAVDVLRARLRKDTDQLAGRRVAALERLARGGVDPLAADEVPERLLGRGRHAPSLAPGVSAPG